METETKYLVSYEDPGREGGTMEGARDVAGSFLRDIPPTPALNASHQPYQLH